MASYQGSCHCGNVAFAVEGEIDRLFQCNCSICSKRAGLHWFVPAAAFSLKTDDAAAGAYTFNKHVIRHRFCKTCGVAPYAEGKKPDGSPMAAVNARCLDDVDISGVAIVPIDGRSF